MTQVKVGKVVSTKMQKTIVVEVEMRKKHPLYKKIIKKSKKIKVHDELGAKMQQKVKIRETKPISKNVHFKTVEVIS
ncbi:30S ribosomal protein S17 [Candidatus Curtissbacteria bacterium RIFCSPLOWO2_01_FULL_38_11b]|uniref:Small ribosomal subunit protein uS17 n=1 Tax=Candidatus Curtissbacteria bacterium RIFCSPLOWO2_01_FULL_38_11b TaxID=1797725 RepID=A0A1F5GZS4_9BACT|nr:MAG: 30S ribosomal protein S17 [Candidatus Curtissbacteria bacterium RIFCSPLOWO2_01_FULL_38_11b]